MNDILLPLIWLMIIGFCIVMYVILDGFTLGTGMLLPLMTEAERDIAKSVILPTWDGNQTWLVLGMASLYGAFPLAFSALLPALYTPLLLMVTALLLRGVAFEFRLKEQKYKRYWDWVFALSSLVAALVQGIILANVVKGFLPVKNSYVVTVATWLTPFTLFAALSLVCGYCLLGSARLIMKTTHHLQEKMFKIAIVFAWLVVIATAVVCIWTPLLNDFVADRWFAEGHWIYLGVLPYLTVMAFIVLIISLFKRNDFYPFWASSVLFLCPYIGFVISIFPYIIPYHLKFYETASPANTLRFMLVGALILLPTLLCYTAYTYRVFGGKVKETLHY